MRWFNGLKANFVDPYRQLTQAFSSRFVMNSRAPQPLSALLSLPMDGGRSRTSQEEDEGRWASKQLSEQGLLREQIAT